MSRRPESGPGTTAPDLTAGQGLLRIPDAQVNPVRAIVRRLGYALAALGLATLAVYLDRDGYTDHDDHVSLLDAAYYSTVSLSTTGYGEIAPFTPRARLVNVLVVTPLRLFFVIVLVGTTLVALTENSRAAYRIHRWRGRIRDHTVIAGFGTKGRAAADAIMLDGADPSRIVVVDPDPDAVERATARGLIAIHGSAAAIEVLRLAGADTARSLIVCPDRDDTALLITLTARQLTVTARLVSVVRHAESARHLRRAGADAVVVGSETAGRLLGVAISNPHAVQIIEDLLTPASGLALGGRPVEPGEIGDSVDNSDDTVLGVVRAERLLRVGSHEIGPLRAGDRLLVVQYADTSRATGERGV
ncbi:potassium channel family protein [Nocardia puris]|uniref:Voltage-gated potassium channel n=1 Tax=Nocardia puris TaxID=208602 RepID=A0A366DAI5_9NOCA|nr:potassium channel family protein [Nocardia puris]MBF6214032.1 potassium channel family protein [Nocardia puris]MBF6368685.1 potassium channel family protein [Nocardia puris]MBF6461586.1 potassium channel family protein [Nocardia puris]RBO86539.1 voltage-gated potassium channel [Nocardia puris]